MEAFREIDLIHDLAVETKTKVRYSETDQMGVVYHANYFVWFNMVRDEILKRLGIDIQEGEKMGYIMPVVEAYCRYYFPARYGDEIIIKGVPERTAVARLVVHYQVIHNKNKRLMAKGKTVNVLMTKDEKLVIRIPEEFKGIIRHLSQ